MDIIKGRTESDRIEINKENNLVVKYYDDKWKSNNQFFNRKGEGYFLNKYRSSLFIHMLGYNNEKITLLYGGEPIGPKDKIVDNPKIDLFELFKYLIELRDELILFDIEHRDINPTNILYNEITKEFKLIDFNWAIEKSSPDNLKTCPTELNTPGYYPSDEDSFNKMFKRIFK